MQPHEPTHITDEQVSECLAALSKGQPYRLMANGYGGERRMVIAPFDDTQELMVAVEGGGCAFLKNDPDTRHNRFIFVQHGFQLPHGVVAEQLLNAVADLIALRAQAAAPLQIEDQSTTEE